MERVLDSKTSGVNPLEDMKASLTFCIGFTVPGSCAPRWLPDGSVATKNGVRNLWQQFLARGASMQLTQFPSTSIVCLAQYRHDLFCFAPIDWHIQPSSS